MKDLRLSLKKQWFEMTKSGVKTEDYRAITEYWCKRLLDIGLSQEHMEGGVIEELITDLNNLTTDKCRFFCVESCLKFYNSKVKSFDNNIMTLGYPKKGDSERTLIYKNAGILIGYGKPQWGAKPDKLYFVIKHVKLIK